MQALWCGDEQTIVCCGGQHGPGSGMGIVPENAHFHSSETDFPQRKKIVHGEKKLAVQKKEGKKESTSFNSAPNTHQTYGARSHAAIACLGHVIVNTVTCCYHSGYKKRKR